MEVDWDTAKSQRMTQAGFAAENPAAKIFMRERPGGAVFLALSPGRVVLVAQGAIASEHIVGVLRDARPTEILGSDAFCALIDVRGFNGAVDWKDIQEIPEIMPKGDSSTNKNAYVVRNHFVGMAAKITAALFAKTECKSFLSEAEARAWLGWE